MASPGRTQVFRALTILALTGAAVAVPASSGQAAPTSCAETRTQFAANGAAAEKTAEALNDAKIARVKTEKALTAATVKARSAAVVYDKSSSDFKQLVTGELKSAPAGQFAVFFTSGSPKEFADQMALMDFVAGRKAQKIQALARTRASAAKAQADVTAKLTERKKIEQTMAAKAADLKKRAATLTGLLSNLCADDQPAVQAERASRDMPRVDVGPASGAAQKAVQTALAQIGDPYVWAAAGPDQFDCSGLTSYAWAAAGVSLPHSSSQQYGYGTHISRSQVRAGDLVFFYSPISHVGIAINNTQMVHASTFGVPVKIASIDSSPFVGATRLG
ncbi:MAG TPA: NlpC/P60 family protein [Mycobacteriales bacterium]|nr:NlpC/P60 family protein [Mycobacteriales bacterium]